MLFIKTETMSSVLIPLAEGCEELEAVTIIDLLRRAGIRVVVAGLAAGPVHCSRGTMIVPDVALDEVLAQPFDMIVLPGGMPGRSEEHTSELQSLMRISYAVFCLKK